MALSVGARDRRLARRHGAATARTARADWAARGARLPGFDAIQNKYCVDEIYQATVVARRSWRCASSSPTWIAGSSTASSTASASLGRGAAWVTGAIDHYIVDGAGRTSSPRARSRPATSSRTVQTGRIQNYVYGLLGGVAFFAIVQYFLK